MFVTVGILMVLGAIVGGYLMEHGPLGVLVQPTELVIIGGAALGTVLISNPMHILKRIISGGLGVLKPSRSGKAMYLEALEMSYELLNKARREGLLALEADIEEPTKSPVLSKYPRFLKDHHARDFVCDTMRMAITGGIDPFDLDQMMELDMEVSHHEANQPVSALSTVADSLPGLGIVAAVLGVVITMGALGGPPEKIGRKSCRRSRWNLPRHPHVYGFVGPIAANMSKAAEEEHAYHQVLRVLLLSFIKGNAPIQALEFARRAIPARVRPTFSEMEATCKGTSAAAPASA